LPEVSVILPTYNRIKTLSRAIESVLNQSFRDLELIVVDDGSTDDTEHYLKDIMHSDKRVKYLKMQTNSGVSKARNTGILAATGRYIAFQDSDDEWLEGKLMKQVHAIKALPEDVGMVYCFKRLMGQDGGSKIITKEKFMPDRTDLYKTFPVHMFRGMGMTISLFRRNVFELCGYFDEKSDSREDTEILIRISKEFKFYCIDEPLINCYRTDDCLTRNYQLKLKASIYIFNKYYDEIKKDRIVLSKHYLNISKKFKRVGMKRDATRYKIRAGFFYMLGKIQNIMRVS